MKFNLNIFAFRKPSGEVQVEHVVPVVIEDQDALFAKSVRKVALNNLADDIQYELDCIAFGKDVVEQTKAAGRVFGEDELNSTDTRKKYPKAMYDHGIFRIPSNHRSLSISLAKKWIEENYK